MHLHLQLRWSDDEHDASDIHRITLYASVVLTANLFSADNGSGYAGDTGEAVAEG